MNSSETPRIAITKRKDLQYCELCEKSFNVDLNITKRLVLCNKCYSEPEGPKLNNLDLISLEEIWNNYPFLKRIQRTRFGFNELHRMSGHSTYCVNNASATISYFQCKTCDLISCNHCGSEDINPDNHQNCENHGRQIIDLSPNLEQSLEVFF